MLREKKIKVNKRILDTFLKAVIYSLFFYILFFHPVVI